MVRIAIVEDTSAGRAKLRSYLERYAREHDCEFDITTYADGIDIVTAYEPGTDILFMDIEMPVLDGMKAARLIRERDASVIIVFVTNLAQYAISGYEVSALDFLVKPLEWDVFVFRMTRILSRMEKRQADAGTYVVLNNGDQLTRVNLMDLVYVEVAHHTLTYHTTKEDITLRSTIREAEELLAGHGFCRCNQCYLVNLRYVTRLEDTVAYVGKYQLNVSRSRKKELIAALTTYVAKT